jgi:transposase
MQGKQDFLNSEAKILEKFIPKDHLLKKIDIVVSFDFIKKITKNLYYKNFGRPSIDPVIIFRMQLIGYMFGISSDRKLCMEIKLNLAYRWFCGFSLNDKIPHHSTLSRVRDRLGVVTYEKIFNKLLSQWHKEGLIGGKTFYSDATIISANASINSMIDRKDTDPNLRILKTYEKRYHDFNVGKKKKNLKSNARKQE